MRKLILAVIAAFTLVAIGLQLIPNTHGTEVNVEPASLQAVSPSILASGTLSYESEIKLVSEVIGRVQAVFVKEGDFVSQGDLLLRLDPATGLAEIAQLEAALRQSKLNIERQRVNADRQTAKMKRYEALRTAGIIDANTYEEMESQRQLAQLDLTTSVEMLGQTQAQLKQARERLAKTEFHAPISGKVTAVFIKAGETAVPSAMSIAGSDLMIIADTRSLYADINVDETDIARVRSGQEARVVPAAASETALAGKVEQVAISPRQTTGQSKSYRVKIRLAQQADIPFHPGMSCRAEIATRSADAPRMLAVPVQAVRYGEAANKDDKAEASVFIAQSGTAHQRRVETGIADDTYIEIVRGVRLGEPIVTGPAKTLHFLKDGDHVVAAAIAATAAAIASPVRSMRP